MMIDVAGVDLMDALAGGYHVVGIMVLFLLVLSMIASLFRRMNSSPSDTGWMMYAASAIAVIAVFHLPIIALSGFEAVAPFWQTVLNIDLFPPEPRFPVV